MPLQALQNLHYFSNMKLWVALLVASWAYWLSMVEPHRCMAATENEQHKLKLSTVRFITDEATANSYLMFMKDLHNALTDRADKSGEIPILPPRSAQPTDPQQYVMVEFFSGPFLTVTLALNASNAYVLGYRPGWESRSYFFTDVPTDARNALFPDTERVSLPFTGRYEALERAAGVGDRREILLGIGVLNQYSSSLNYMNPFTNSNLIAKALIGCIQMVSEAVRLRNIQQRMLALAAPRADGSFGVFYPDGLMLEYENKWEEISSAIQSATDGIFGTPVRLEYGGGQKLVLSTVREVVFTIAMMPAVCGNSILRMPTASSPSLSMSMTSSGLKDNGDTCERVLAPTSYIIGQNGLCVDVYNRNYTNGNKIILWECGKNQVNQLWTLRSDDNTIRSGGKCLTHPYASGDNVMIYDCNTAVPGTTKWEIHSDGTIRSPIFGLVLTGNKDRTYKKSGLINLVAEANAYGSNQAFYATNNTKPAFTTIVGYKGLCLVTSDGLVWLDNCVSHDAGQHWTIYPDWTIRPRTDKKECLKYVDGNSIAEVHGCKGWTEERWRFQNDGTILHVTTGRVLEVKDTGASLLEITVSEYNNQRASQIWFQGQP
ncbi:hypothetical protein HRI_003277800 [Hibiscus trionum]|uniref:Ribosome-inactivating protein n=1 Tax=Hibiscus trionum TaxID=183268 RepID=A0A9W7IJN9_HIBTR|nr:hypothetical protein HRI_003277800 [Hibiscus trionum]